jgi:hypothetical protein
MWASRLSIDNYAAGYTTIVDALVDDGYLLARDRDGVIQAGRAEFISLSAAP